MYVNRHEGPNNWACAGKVDNVATIERLLYYWAYKQAVKRAAIDLKINITVNLL